MTFNPDDVTWTSPGNMKATHALLYDDRPLRWWDRFKVAWRYLWTGDFVDPRMVATVHFDEDGINFLKKVGYGWVLDRSQQPKLVRKPTHSRPSDLSDPQMGEGRHG